MPEDTDTTLDALEGSQNDPEGQGQGNTDDAALAANVNGPAVDTAQVGKGDPRVINMTFASEEWLPGFFGQIRLKCAPKNVDLRRVDMNRMSFCADHDTTKPIGRVTRAYARNNVVHARVEMAKTSKSEEYLEEMDAGLRSGTSPGFIVHEVRRLTEDDEEYDEDEFFQLEVTRWEPYEISTTPIPRNPTVGMQMAASMDGGQMMLSNGSVIGGGAHLIEQELKLAQMQRGQAMPEDNANQNQGGETTQGNLQPDWAAMEQRMNASIQEATTAAQAATAQAEAAQAQVETAQAEVQTANTERERVERENEIMRLGLQHNQGQLAVDHITEGGDATAFRDKLISLNYERKPVSKAGIPASGQFNLARLLAARMQPSNKDLQTAAAPEFAAIYEHDLKPQSGGEFVIPMEHLSRPRTSEQFEVTVGTNTAGYVDEIAGVQYAAQFLIDRAPILQLCETIPGLEGNFEIPVMATDPTVVAVTESADPADRSGAFGPSVSLTPHRADASVWFSTQSVIQTGGWIDSFLRQQLGLALAQHMSSQILVGTGTNNQVEGLNVTSGTNTENYSAANRGSWGSFVNMQTDVDAAKIPDIRRAYVVNNDVYHQARQTAVDPGSGLFTIRGGNMWNVSGTTMMMPTFAGPIPGGQVGGDIPTFKTTLLGNNNILYAEWTEVFVGIWRAMEVITDMITRPGTVKVTAITYWDMGLRRTPAVTKATQS